MAAAGLGLRVQDATAPQRTATVIRAGWPLPALRSTRLAKLGTGGAGWTQLTGLWRSGPMVPSGAALPLVASWSHEVWGRPIVSTRSTNLQRRIPLEPLWPGFAANTVVYSGSLFLSVATVHWARRAARRSRGLCGGCGYSLAGNSTGVCPECGDRCAVTARE